MPRILFTTAFKPYGIDNQFSRRDSFPEVFHNRITRGHGIFSYRGFFSAFGLHVIANNISAESAVLEYPSFDRFKKELKNGYDYVGIGSVVANLEKVRVMAEAVRMYSPRTKIIVGGYCANVDEIRKLMPLDYLCVGEGVSFMRELLGDPEEYEFKNPDVFSRAHSVMGVPLLGRKNPHIVVGLGCPYGCEYCSPSHHFGRKYVRFFKDGRSLFREMERMEKKFCCRTFGFIGDDNFLIDLKRAEELRECVVESGKIYEIFLFASADKIREFGVERLAEMGANIVWIGRESCYTHERKKDGVDLKALVGELHDYGIKTVISSMLLMEHHTKDNIGLDIEDHLGLQPDFSMITFYVPLPGTPLYKRYREEGKIMDLPYEDWNGISRPYSLHPQFTGEEAGELRDHVLKREYHELGPSIIRWIRTDLKACLHLSASDNPNLRRRAEHLAKKMSNYRALLWAVARLVPTPEMREMTEALLAEVENAFGPITAWEKTEGLGLFMFGGKQKLRHRLIGDVIQPPTTVTRYPAS